MADQFPPQLIEAIGTLTQSRVVIAASCAVLVWEWLTCIGLEYKYIWKSEIKFTSVIFLLLRYFTFVALAILTWFFFWTGSDELCARMISCIQILPTIVLALADVLICVRIYALYNKNRLVLAFLGSILAAQIVTQSWNATLITAAKRPTTLVVYCLPSASNEYALVWGLPMAFDTVVMVLALAKLCGIWKKGGQSRLVQVLLRDQVLWYLLIESISIVNLVVSYASPARPGSRGRGTVSCVVTTLTSISACRIILNIRKTAEQDSQLTLPKVGDGSQLLTFPRKQSGSAGTVSASRQSTVPAYKLETHKAEKGEEWTDDSKMPSTNDLSDRFKIAGDGDSGHDVYIPPRAV